MIEEVSPAQSARKELHSSSLGNFFKGLLCTRARSTSSADGGECVVWKPQSPIIHQKKPQSPIVHHRSGSADSLVSTESADSADSSSGHSTEVGESRQGPSKGLIFNIRGFGIYDRISS